jgi:chromosome partitioning protein
MAANLDGGVPQTVIARPLARLNAAKMAELAEQGRRLTTAIRDQATHPDHRKKLRTFQGFEVVKWLGGITVETLYRRLKRDPSLPQGVMTNARRRDFTLEDIHRLQEAFGIRPRRRPGQPGLVVSICNFKGGVAKTTTTAHLGQYLCLMGYRVLMIDLDAQASLTQLFGILPHAEVDDAETIRPIMEGPSFAGEPNPDYDADLRRKVRKTHWDDLDLIVSNLGVYGSEFAIAARIANTAENPGFLYYRQLADHLESLRQDYDVILLDTAPSLSFLNSNAMFAADALLVTLPPAMLDTSSAALFFQLMGEVVEQIDTTEGTPKEYDFGAILLTRFKPNDATHQQISNYVRTYFPDYTCTNAMLQTTALEKVGPDLLTLYEVAEYEGDRRTFERGVDAMNDANAEIESLIRRALEARAQAATATAAEALPA